MRTASRFADVCVVSSDVQELGLDPMLHFLYGLKTEVTGEGGLWLFNPGRVLI